MINVLLPSMGKSNFFKESFFPKSLVEIKGKTMLELVIDNYKLLNPKSYIFVFSEEDCLRFHIDSSAKILANCSEIIKLRNQTSGALCTCLMAAEYINDGNPLVIANCDQVIDVDYSSVLRHFDRIEADAGVITFPNIHPRWSYARKNGEEIVEVAEKRPLSKDAIAGFYYYKHGRDFIEAAKRAIMKQNCTNGKYYISASINEMILMGKRIGYFDINKNQYHSFYSPAKIKEYEGANYED